jgi:hypothetical protein
MPTFDVDGGDPSLAPTSGRIGAFKDLMLGGAGDAADPFGKLGAVEEEDPYGGEALQAVSAYEVPMEDAAATLDTRAAATFEAGHRSRGPGGGGGWPGPEEVGTVAVVPTEFDTYAEAPAVTFDEGGGAPLWGGASDPFSRGLDESGVAPAREAVVDADADADSYGRDGWWGAEAGAYAAPQDDGSEGYLYATAEPVPLERRR